MKAKIKIDIESGLYIEQVHPDESGEDIIETPCLQPFNRPKWTGIEWIEGGVMPEPTTPEKTLEEKVAEHDIKIVTLEETIDVIYGG